MKDEYVPIKRPPHKISKATRSDVFNILKRPGGDSDLRRRLALSWGARAGYFISCLAVDNTMFWHVRPVERGPRQTKGGQGVGKEGRAREGRGKEGKGRRERVHEEKERREPRGRTAHQGWFRRQNEP